MTLNKAGIANIIQAQTGLSKKKCTEALETALKIIKSELESGEDVLISGFGKFCVKEKRKRRGRNPATGEDMMLAPRRVVIFRCSGKLRDRIDP